jgi:predicted transcriptional regulator
MNVLLSIKPKYAEAIMRGEKKYEFRKSGLKHLGGSKAYIYMSSPVRMIVASFRMERIFEDRPSILWKKYRRYAGIERQAFFDYFANAERGLAIQISKLNVLDKPLRPSEFIRNFVPPQSFMYVKDSLADLLA